MYSIIYAAQIRIANFSISPNTLCMCMFLELSNHYPLVFIYKTYVAHYKLHSPTPLQNSRIAPI